MHLFMHTYVSFHLSLAFVLVIICTKEQMVETLNRDAATGIQMTGKVSEKGVGELLCVCSFRFGMKLRRLLG